jgi:hypothetical protein
VLLGIACGVLGVEGILPAWISRHKLPCIDVYSIYVLQMYIPLQVLGKLASDEDQVWCSRVFPASCKDLIDTFWAA